MDRIGTDILGSFPVSDNNNRYVLLIGDHFSKWISAVAIPYQTASTVAHEIVYNCLSIFGMCLELQ